MTTATTTPINFYRGVPYTPVSYVPPVPAPTPPPSLAGAITDLLAALGAVGIEASGVELVVGDGGKVEVVVRGEVSRPT